MSIPSWGHFFYPKKICTSQSSAPGETLPSQLNVRTTPQPDPTLSPPICKPCPIFLLLHQLIIKGASPAQPSLNSQPPGCKDKVEMRPQAAVLDGKWVWTPPRVAALGPLAHVHVCFLTFRFHLTAHCSWAHLILGLGGSDKIQHRRSGCGPQVPCCLAVRPSVSDPLCLVPCWVILPPGSLAPAYGSM